MPPTYLPLRWESTGDQWWYASPIDWAAANGHYDLVRELLRIDNNHFIKLTSLRRIRRLETVWDDEEHFHDVAQCRSQVARKLFHECESKKGKSSLIRSGYGGWLLYTAASAGDLAFVRELLERDPLIIFGEGEYGVTDMLYAAARSKKSQVFRLLLDYAVSPRFSAGKSRELGDHIEEVPPAFRSEMLKRAVHAAARGGDLVILKELLGNCSDVLAYRDARGSTILHAAAGRGQVEVVKHIVATYDILDSTDNQGNTALHVAAYKGQLAAVEALILGAPWLIHSRNNGGETFLHMAVLGFQSHTFRRLNRQIEFMKQLVWGKVIDIEEIINVRSNSGRTALHMAITGGIHSDLVELLMTVRSMNVNVRDVDGMTPLDLLRQRPHSVSSDKLARQLISAGGMFSFRDYTARRAIASHLKMQGSGDSPGTSFRVSDAQIFSCTGIESLDQGGSSAPMSLLSPEELSEIENEIQKKSPHKKPPTVHSAAHRLKGVLHWPRIRDRQRGSPKKCKESSGSFEFDETPIPLRQRFSKPSSLPNNKRTLSVRSNTSSPTNRKKIASGLVHGVMQAMPSLSVSGQPPSSTLTCNTSTSSSTSVDKLKAVCVDGNEVGPSCSNQPVDDETPRITGDQRSINTRLRLCFGRHGRSAKNSIVRHRESQRSKHPAGCNPK